MRGRPMVLVAAVLGLLGLFPMAGARADDNKDLPGPIDSITDLKDTGKMLFKLADTNNDGFISQREAVDAGNLIAGGFFFRADTNGDGTVTQDEARQAREALLTQRPLLRLVFQRAQQETNRQGNPAQVTQARQTVMNVVDTNHDGNIQAPELRQAVQTSVQSIFLMADRNGDGQLDTAEVNQAMVDAGRTAIQTAFNAADTDKNGALSQAEFDQAIINPAHVVFRILDSNNDNQISREELRSGAQVLSREIRALRVPEPPNSVTNQIRQQAAGQPVTASPSTVAPVQPVRPAPAPAPVVPATPPQR